MTLIKGVHVTLGQHALALAKRGLAIFPCKPRDKVPITEHGFKDATTDPDTIKRWWHQEPEANIGISTGARSRVFVVDVDGVDAEAELKKLEAQNGALPATIESITTRGRHLYFEWSDKTPVRNTAGKIAPGLDTRGEGGYVLAPPSVHPSGRSYCWSVDSASVFAAAPQWLLNKLTNGNGRSAAPPTAWCELIRNGVDDGHRNDTIARLAGHFLRKRVDPFVVLETLLAWNAVRCRPPLDDAEVATIVDSIARREAKRWRGT
jgi:hypothetical protein